MNAQLAVLLEGCNTQSSVRSSGNATVGARKVSFSLDGPGGISPTADSATVSFEGGSVLIEKGRVLLDGKEVAKLPEAAKAVDVAYTAGALTVSADGAKVYETKIGK